MCVNHSWLPLSQRISVIRCTVACRAKSLFTLDSKRKSHLRKLFNWRTRPVVGRVASHTSPGMARALHPVILLWEPSSRWEITWTSQCEKSERFPVHGKLVERVLFIPKRFKSTTCPCGNYLDKMWGKIMSMEHFEGIWGQFKMWGWGKKTLSNHFDILGDRTLQKKEAVCRSLPVEGHVFYTE